MRIDSNVYNIGYACITLGLKNAGLKTCRLQNAEDDRLKGIIENNLNALETVIKYNAENDIRLFRISSDIIPLASHPLVSIEWCSIFREKIKKIGELIIANNIRVSMHPGQYTVLNSLSESVVENAIDDLKYHAYFLDCLGVDESCKIVLHIGGVYGDKKQAINRFVLNYKRLDKAIKRRLIIENDDKNYNIEDVLNISAQCGIPVVFDNLHHQINPAANKNSQFEWIERSGATWKEKDGPQKIHYSQQNIEKSAGAHSKTIDAKVFSEFLNDLPDRNIDIMLEVKDKNISAVKCILYSGKKYSAKHLETEWARYKYYVLGKYPEGYYKIRELLKDKTKYLVKDFYEIIEEAISCESIKNNEINAAQHVAGYFRKLATDTEKRRIINSIEKYREVKISLKSMKKTMRVLAEKYDIEYLLNSYYFIEW